MEGRELRVGNSSVAWGTLYQVYAADREAERGCGGLRGVQLCPAGSRAAQGHVGDVGTAFPFEAGGGQEVFYRFGDGAQVVPALLYTGPQDAGFLLRGEGPEARGGDFERVAALAEWLEGLLDGAEVLLRYVAQELQG